MRIELTIKTDYLPGWGAWEGVREIIQNAKDGEAQYNAPMIVAYDPTKRRLTVANDGVVLGHETLLLGQTTKAGAVGVIGQFGEGLKLGLLALVRAGHGVTIRNGGEVWTPVIVTSAQFGVPVLAVEVEPGKAGAARRISVSVDGIGPDDWQEMRDRFLFLAKPAGREVTHTDHGDLLHGERFRGRLYVKGIFVQADPKLEHGYNFAECKLDRDRKMLDGWDRDRWTGYIWRNAMRAKPGLVEAFATMLESEAHDIKGVNEYTADAFVDEAVAEKLAKRFRKVHGATAVPVTSLADSADIEHLGRRGVVVGKALAAALAKTIGTMETVKAGLANETVRLHSWANLAPAAQENLMRALKLINAAGTTVGLAEVDVVDFRSDNLLGQYHHGSGRIKLALRVVENAKDCLATLVHEVAHRAGGDGDKGHVAAIEDLWAAIVTNLTDAAPVVAAAPVAAVPAAPRATYGKPGTAAECYRRHIMANEANPVTDAVIFERVLAEVGAEKAGKPAYVSWYRNQLRKDGFCPPEPVK